MSALYYLNECSSTNDEILSLLGNDNVGKVAVYTFFQTKGRGQYGNLWETSKNQNIAFSFALNSNEVKISEEVFNFCTALYVREFLANLTNKEVQVKWPNDLILNKKKISGILIEKKKVNEKSYYIIGIGINVLQEDFSQLTKAGSLLTQAGLEFDLHLLAENLFTWLQIQFDKTVEESDAMVSYNTHLFMKNKVAVFDLNGVRQNGIILKADADGFLWIDLEKDGKKKFFNKEINLLY